MNKEITNNLDKLIRTKLIQHYEIKQVDFDKYDIFIIYKLNNEKIFIDMRNVDEFCLIRIEYFKELIKEQMIINYKRYLAKH